MPADQIEEISALVLIFAVHVVGGLALVWALLDEKGRAGWKRRWGWGSGPAKSPPSPSPPAGVRATPAPLPLADSATSPVRLREPVRVSDAYPRPARRPEHPPQPAREPQHT